MELDTDELLSKRAELYSQLASINKQLAAAPRESNGPNAGKKRRNETRRNHWRFNLASRIMTRLYVSEKDRAYTINDLRDTLARFDYRSVWNNSSNDLTVVRIDADRPLTPENAMVVDIFEARQTRDMDEGVRALARTIAATFGSNTARNKS